MINPTEAHDFETLLRALQQPGVFPEASEPVRYLETHISVVFLTGRFAYKIKKPLNLGFLDFQSLAARRFYCEEELRLNRRLAPDLYLDVVPITGKASQPEVGGSGTPIEYAVKMVQFPQSGLFDRQLEQDALTLEDMDDIAEMLARFHASLPPAATSTEFGSPQAIAAPALQNFDQIGQHLPKESLHATRHPLEILRDWTAVSLKTLAPHFEARRAHGFVRECHGDLHLGNIARYQGHVEIFDGIEFNENFRWIDTASEVAFLTMDLLHRQRAEMAHHFLNAYIEASGDYEALGVIRFYLVYRAMVRAKIHSIEAAQSANAERRRQAMAIFQEYLDLAGELARDTKPFLAITHGFSGSGKSTVAALLVRQFGAIRVRSDAERKRLAAQLGTRPQDTYGQELTERTYARLLQIADTGLAAGKSVVVDATFLDAAPRRQFCALAQARHVPFLVLDVHASTDALEERLRHRQSAGTDVSDADVAVLRRQLEKGTTLSSEESAFVVRVQTEAENYQEELARAVQRRIAAVKPDS